ncbi:MAG: tRNA glutamyl-Q(34) synthetase GluQRS [Eubacteriales bacterium]|nr:tRNA glutamyl-Q(34) synthetase GluQRS [Eubacteriales bacterium]
MENYTHGGVTKGTPPFFPGEQHTPVGRFAPSPSGRMHLGNVFCALLAWLSARAAGGKMILRIEDLDPVRSRREYARALEDDLQWLGLTWDEGGSRGGPNAPYFQSQRAEYYDACLKSLRERGLLYPCFCTRAQLHAQAPHGLDGEYCYDGACAGLSPQEAEMRARTRAPAWRVRVRAGEIGFTDGLCGSYAQDLSTACGDFVVCRADGVAAYQLAVTADDAAMGVTEVVRGRDLLSSTPRQLYLYELLGYSPPSFRHIPLLLAPDGRRLSKRERDLDMESLRRRFLPGQIIGLLAALAGQVPFGDEMLPHQLIKGFNWANVPAENITLTAARLAWLSGEKEGK